MTKEENETSNYLCQFATVIELFSKHTVFSVEIVRKLNEKICVDAAMKHKELVVWNGIAF